MPTVKLGSISQALASQIQQRHNEVDQKFWELLSLIDYETKIKLLSKLPLILSEIKAEAETLEQGLK